MSWQVIPKKQFHKDFLKLSPDKQERIEFAIDELKLNFWRCNLTKLKGEQALWRIRLGDCRIIVHLDTKNKIIYLLTISKRTTTTYKKR